MKQSRIRKIGMEMVAWSMIGSGVVRLLTPKRHARRWAIGPFRRPAGWAAERPTFMRATGVIRLAAGMWLARRLATR